MTSSTIVIGLGANLGDRLTTMREAVVALGRVPGVRVTAKSSVYESAPVGGVPQPEFLNAAVLVECTSSPLLLLDTLLSIEAELGRTRSPGDVRWGPRSIDLDVLWIEGLVCDDTRLIVPHPRLTERAFALVPMLEVAPHAINPRTGEPFVAPATGDVRMTSLSL